MESAYASVKVCFKNNHLLVAGENNKESIDYTMVTAWLVVSRLWDLKMYEPLNLDH